MNVIKSVSLTRPTVAAPEGVVLIVVAGFNEPLVRKPKQFLADMQGSFLIGNEVLSLNSKTAMLTMAGLKGSIIENELTANKIGDTYTVSEDHPALKPDHADYGNIVVGEKIAYKTNSTFLPFGEFLDITLSSKERESLLVADATASMRMQLENFLAKHESTPPEVATIEDAVVEETAAAAEVVGAKKKK